MSVPLEPRKPVYIPSVLNGARWHPQDGLDAPELKENTLAAIQVQENAFLNPADIARFRKSKAVTAQELLQVFSLVQVKASDDWRSLAEILPEFAEAKQIEPRLGRLFGHGELTIAIERQYIDKDYRDTFSAYFSKRFHTPWSRCVRLHFFRGSIALDQIRDIPNEAYLGYSVLRPLDTGGLGRTLLAGCLVESTRESEHLHAKSCDEQVNLLGRDFKISGFPYIGQDTEVAVCAQAALWMMVRYFSNRYPNYREIGPHQLAHLVSDFSLGRIFPSPGLAIWQASEILRRLGFHPVIHELGTFEKDPSLAQKLGFAGDKPEKAFQHLFYTYIESGIPLLVAYKSHAVVAFGHASDYHEQPAKADASTDGFYHSSVWNRRFLIHDDARLPYQFLDLDDASSRPFSDVEAFIAPMPEKTFLPADEYQRLALGLLRSPEFGWAEKAPDLAEASAKGEIVLRSFLTTGSNLKRSLEERGMDPQFKEAYLHYSLPHFIWISEIHSLAKYPNECIGQIVWNGTASSRDAKGFLFLHYPEVLFMNTTPHFNRPLRPLQDDIRELRLHRAGAGFRSFRPFARNLSKFPERHVQAKGKA